MAATVATMFEVPEGRSATLFQFCQVTGHAVRRLIELATHDRSGDSWAEAGMLNLLKYTCIRQLELGQVLVATLHQSVKRELFAQGISDMYYMYHSGLFDRDGEPIILVLVKGMSNSHIDPSIRQLVPYSNRVFLLTEDNVIGGGRMGATIYCEGQCWDKLDALWRRVPADRY